ncbi:MarR family winged helix-turn-helix transcriptional regulator [Companilactobacillus jidongensis]|uniref:MarR family winged helix-turn-helix transcriptional regulator n=1 Tax=Companilactobacillus jidongensis TaxID=2486006 RepID=UPI000F79BD1F|nr:MarR family transcriptional regulator [Companilactobacillus jidongensis]
MEHHFYRTCAYFTAARYMRSIEKIADKIFAPTKMNPSYSYIMMNVEDHNPSSIMEITRELGYDRSSVSRMVKILENKKLVSLIPYGRSTQVELTKSGREFLVIANQCLDEFGHVTDELLGDDKSKMTNLLTENNNKLGEK